MKVEEHKIKKTGEPLVLHLVETPDIVGDIGGGEAAGAMACGLRAGNRRPAFSGDHEDAKKRVAT